MRRSLPAWGALFAIGLAGHAAAADLPWKDLRPTAVLSDLGGPVDFALASDGSVWWNEYYTGNVTRYDPATGSREVRFHADPVPQGVERGLVGLALDPDVGRNGVFYVYYTVADAAHPEGGTNRLSRVDHEQETVLLTLSAARLHNGGRILIAPDGSLFVATGENDRGTPAQDPASLLGKVLHLYADGRPAPGNLQGHVYSMGHRNMYGLAYNTKTHQLFATENGNAERDEVNLILAGGNYGWPSCEGLVQYDYAKGQDTDRPCDDPRFTPPLGEFYANRTAAPTGAAVLDGKLYWASWNEGSIHRLVQASDGRWTDEMLFRQPGRINDLEAGLDGRSLYFSNWTHILRLAVPVEAPPAGPNPAAPVPTPGTPIVAALGALLFAAARQARALQSETRP